MAIRLIINADDYGRTAGISQGIRQAHLQGVVTSTTCMMNLSTIEADLQIALRNCPRMGLGVHLNLTFGRPLSDAEKINSLVNHEGLFDGLDGLLTRFSNLNLDQVEVEWRAQINRFVALTGKKPTHLDSHHHSSYFTSELFSRMLKLAGEFSCNIRFPMIREKVAEGLPEKFIRNAEAFLPGLLHSNSIRCPDCFYTTFYDEGISINQIFSILDSLTVGTSEIMTHPGLVDSNLDSTYNFQREKELLVLTQPSLRARIEEQEIELIHFGKI